MSVTNGVVAVVIGLAVLAPSLAAAEAKLVKAAKDAGFPAQNCQYCHTTKVPKKETFKPEDLNERGKWLSAEKKKRNQAKPEAAWLKDYPGGKD